MAWVGSYYQSGVISQVKPFNILRRIRKWEKDDECRSEHAELSISTPLPRGWLTLSCTRLQCALCIMHCALSIHYPFIIHSLSIISRLISHTPFHMYSFVLFMRSMSILSDMARQRKEKKGKMQRDRSLGSKVLEVLICTLLLFPQSFLA